MRRLLTPILLLCLLQSLAGCGTPGSPSAATSTASGIPASSPSNPPGSASGNSTPTPSGVSGTPDALTRLTIKIKQTPDSPAVTSLLVCHGAAAGSESTVVDADGACTALAAHGNLLLAPAAAPEQKCTMQMGSTHVATVSGTLHGKDVKATFSQTDGCKIAVWNMLAPLLGGQAGER